MAEQKTFEERIGRVEELIASVESWPDAKVRETALELVQTLMDFHGAGISQMMELTAAAGAAGYAIFDGFEKDDLVSNLLMLYGVHPVPLEDRIDRAIDSVRPSLNLHEGDVEVLSILGGVVTLRLKGSCNGCPSSALTLKHTIEEAIYTAAPDVTAIEVEGSVAAVPTNGFVQIEKPREHVYADCEFVAAPG
jgi:Fe-S cluster biogenesis protein NfuA